MSYRTCIISQCETNQVARGLCQKHYNEMYTAGRIAEFKKLPRPRLPLAERFRRIGWKVTASGCWEWSGSLNSNGYGQISSGAKSEGGHAAPMVASRLAWTIANGPIPEGLFVCHKCDNPPCVNPDHLFLGTPLDNAADMARKRRTLNGERRPQSKLTDMQVDEIRAWYKTGIISQKSLGQMYGVDASAISLIVNRRRRRNNTYPEAA